MLVPTIFLLQLLVGTLYAGITPHLVTLPTERDYFTAAVFEHARLGNWTTDKPEDFVSKNLDYYRRAAEIAQSKGAEIIVFPEYGFYPGVENREDIKPYLETVPDPKTGKWNPCIQLEEFSQRPTLRSLSCMARNNNIVVVANMPDMQPCTAGQQRQCPDDGVWHHNANVAFDKDGTVIGVYRKEHLFFEAFYDLPLQVQDPIFHTDFGTFAMYICFESIFPRMTLSGLNTSIDAVIISAYWLDYRPLWSAHQHWWSWAIGNNANLIASNAQVPEHGTQGSGIFHGRMGAMKYTFASDGQSKLIVSKLRKKRYQGLRFRDDESSITVLSENGSAPYDVHVEDEGKNIPDICYYPRLTHPYKYMCFQVLTVNYTFHQLTEPEGTAEACSNGLCCSVSYSADSMNETFYLGVFNGSHNSFDRYYWCEEVCFVMRCDAFNGSVCNSFPAKSNTIFKRLELTSNFTTNSISPSILKSRYRLPQLNEFEFDVQGANNSYTSRLAFESKDEKPLLAAVMNGRCFDRDPPYTR